MNDVAGRRIFLMVVFIALILLIIIRLVDLNFIQSQTLKQLGDQKHLGFINHVASRGKILDRYRNVLAKSVLYYQLIVDPSLALSSPIYIQKLSRFLDEGVGRLRARLEASASRRYFILKKGLNYQQYKADKNRLKNFKLQGLYWENKLGRFYPYREATAHLIGFTNYQGKGQAGLELYLDQYLSGQSSRRQVILNSQRQVVGKLGWDQSFLDGQDAQLSLDIDAQLIFYETLRKAFVKHQAASAGGLLIDVEKSSILALVNQPAFDPNDRGTIHPAWYRNRVVWDLFEPGSTIKPFILSAALGAGVIDESSIIKTTSPWRILGHEIVDIKSYDQLTPKQIIKKSSNVGAAKIAKRLAPEVLQNRLSDFGFNQNCLAGDFYKYHGQLSHHKNWYGTDQAILGYGYGTLVSLLQLACSYLVLANDGVYRSLNILEDKAYNLRYAEKPERVLAATIAQKMKTWMVSSVEDGGTARHARLLGYRVGGKTGTVKYFDVKRKAYSNHQHLSLFIGMVMDVGSRYLMLVMINQPQNQYYGGQVAAPVFKAVMSKFLRLKNQ